MSEMVDRVAKAIAESPRVFVRSADDGYAELCRYGSKGEPEIIMLMRVAPGDDLDSVKDRIINDLRARAAIAAMCGPVADLVRTALARAAIQYHPLRAA